METRVARNGQRYTQAEFTQFYNDDWQWDQAVDTSLVIPDAPPSNATQLAVPQGTAVWPLHDELAAAIVAPPGNATQLAVHAPQLAVPMPAVLQAAGAGGALQPLARLSPDNVAEVRRAEAMRGRPRPLHALARDALNTIAQDLTYTTVNLDDFFPWVPYVAAHRRSDQIIGPGITGAFANFFPAQRDANRGGAPRLDFCFHRLDGTVCRVHPGNKPKHDAALVIQAWP